MAPNQFDLLRCQSQAAVQNELKRAVGTARRETSLVNQASQLIGRAVLDREAALQRDFSGRSSVWRRSEIDVVKTEPPPVGPAADGYIRRSPVQPLCEAADYRKRRMLRIVGTAVLAVAAVAAVYLLSKWGLLRQ